MINQCVSLLKALKTFQKLISANMNLQEYWNNKIPPNATAWFSFFVSWKIIEINYRAEIQKPTRESSENRIKHDQGTKYTVFSAEIFFPININAFLTFHLWKKHLLTICSLHFLGVSIRGRRFSRKNVLAVKKLSDTLSCLKNQY